MKATTTDAATAVLLQSAIVTAVGKGKNHQCRAIFDTGAQRSFITEKRASKLQLDVIGEEYLNIFSFGQPTEIY